MPRGFAGTRENRYHRQVIRTIMSNLQHSDIEAPVLTRRSFLKGTAAAIATTAWPHTGQFDAAEKAPPVYSGPRVIIVRFGGGVRRRETIDPNHTFSRYFYHDLCRRGVLFSNMEIGQLDGVETSHGQGTLYLLTGKYDRFKDVRNQLFGQRFESQAPTLFEYLRKYFAVPAHRALIINGEDRSDEEFYSFSNHHAFGARFRSSVLSLYRFKTYLLRQQIAAGIWTDQKLVDKQKELVKLESLDHRSGETRDQGAAIERFWQGWRRHYGDSGLVNPRGDRLLTELALRSLKELRPVLLMIHYNDPDYVHWGNPSHYSRAIAVIDDGLRQLVGAVEADPEYRGNTIFVVVPDCGRDSNPLMAVPYQHHFNSRSAHEIFGLFFGPGIGRGKVIDRRVEQISVAATVGRLMGFPTGFAEGPVLPEVFV